MKIDSERVQEVVDRNYGLRLAHALRQICNGKTSQWVFDAVVDNCVMATFSMPKHSRLGRPTADTH